MAGAAIMPLGFDIFVEFVFDSLPLLRAELISYFHKVTGYRGILDHDRYLEPICIFRFEVSLIAWFGFWSCFLPLNSTQGQCLKLMVSFYNFFLFSSSGLKANTLER